MCTNQRPAVPNAVCFTIAGAPLAAPTVFSSLGSGVAVFNQTVVTAPNGHVQGYFGVWSGGAALSVRLL